MTHSFPTRRSSDLAIGGSDNHQLVASLTVFTQQLDCLGQHNRFDAVTHVVQMPLCQHLHLRATQNFQTKIQVLGVVELAGQVRSEEHTSELRSLMRISYAVFCLKKKKTHNK